MTCTKSLIRRTSSQSPSPVDAGVTLVELLTVCLILGVLSSISVPYLLNQRERARVASLESDLRNAGTSMEAYFADRQLYPSVEQRGAVLVLGNQSVQLSPGVSIRAMTGPYVVPGTFCLEGTVGDVPAVRSYDSDGGGLLTRGCS